MLVRSVPVRWEQLLELPALGVVTQALRERFTHLLEPVRCEQARQAGADDGHLLAAGCVGGRHGVVMVVIFSLSASGVLIFLVVIFPRFLLQVGLPWWVVANCGVFKRQMGLESWMEGGVQSRCVREREGRGATG